MRIGILATHKSEEQDRLYETAKAKGHTSTILEVQKLSLGVFFDDPKVYHNEKDIHDDFDIIIPRIDIPYTDFGYRVLRQFQVAGTYVTDTAYSLELGRNKIRCLQYLSRKGIPFPKTAFSYTSEGYNNLLDVIDGESFIIKLNEGTQGIGVFLAEDKKQANNFLRTFDQIDVPVMLQEFIEESAGTDLRCFVVGGKVIASMRRKAQDGDFRANISLGGHSEKSELTPEEENMALKASEAIGLNIAGVDLISSNRGPLVIEVNTAPDFMTGEWGLEKISGVDVAGAIIDFAISGYKEFSQAEGGWLD